MELPENIRQWFLESGWNPQSEVEVPEIVPRNHPAWRILRTFGGITLQERNCDPDDDPIAEFIFGAFPPRTAVVRTWSALLESQLVKVARVHNDHAELYMDESGRCFGNSLIHDAFYFCGHSFVDLLEGELENRRHRPLLRPGQSTMRLYGETITQDDPRVYHYRNDA